MNAFQDLKNLKGFAPIVIYIVIGYLLLGGGMLIYHILCPTQAGQFGDMFGGITALFSSLSFAGVLYTIIQQGSELALARKALNNSTEELKLTRQEFEKQNETSKEQLNTNILLQQTTRLQRVENTMFNLIGLMQTPNQLTFTHIIANIEFTVFREKSKNEEISLTKIFNKEDGKSYYELNEASLPFITKRYNAIEKAKLPESFYQIVLSTLTYIKDSAQSDETKNKLVDIFKSLLTPEALIAILYHFQLHQAANKKFINPEVVKFASKFGFFENVNRNAFVNGTYNKLFSLVRVNDANQ